MELKNKRILVTGADGFVGSALVKYLSKERAYIISLGKKKSSTQIGISYHVGLVQKKRQVDQLVKKFRVEIIYHLAAQSLVEEGQVSPISTFESNIQGTWNILESARIHKVKKVIVASTVQVYGNNPKVPFTEKYFPMPSRPYETSKACADLLAQSYADTYGLSVEIPRFSNIYGPGDTNFNRIIPKIIKSLIVGKNPTLWDVGVVRDFLFIDDAVMAYSLLVKKELPIVKRGRVFNFGSGKPISIVDLAKKIISLTNQKKKLVILNLPEDRQNEIKTQYVSIEKANKILGWKPRVLLQDGLQKTYPWYQKYLL